MIPKNEYADKKQGTPNYSGFPIFLLMRAGKAGSGLVLRRHFAMSTSPTAQTTMPMIWRAEILSL